MNMVRNRCVCGSLVIITCALGFSFFNSYYFVTHNVAHLRQFYPVFRVTPDSYSQNLIDCLTYGQWEINNSVRKEKYTMMDKTIRKLRTSQYGLPNPLQRPDNRCGNISFSPALTWYRAVCDPHQSTPCCYQGICQNLSTEQCKCDDCYDLRQDLHAELSIWKNKDNRCQVRDMSRAEACKGLGITEMQLVGDSHMLRTHSAFLRKFGGAGGKVYVAEDTPAEAKVRCRGAHMGSEKCRKYLVQVNKVCGGNITLVFRWLSTANVSQKFIHLTASLLNKPGSLIVIGIGHHDSFDYENISSHVTGPVLDMIEKSGNIWPKVIWAGGNSMGTLKSPTHPKQTNPYILKFNKSLRKFVTQRGVTFLDWYNLTKNLQSGDGSHFLSGAVNLKVRVFVNFLKGIGGVNNLPDFTSKRV